MRKTRLFWKLFGSFLVVAVVLLAVQTIFTAGSTRNAVEESRKRSLVFASGQILPIATKAYFADSASIGKTLSELSSIHSKRITLAATNGKILADSVSNGLPQISFELQKHMLLQTKPVVAKFSLFDKPSLVCSVPVMDGAELVATVLVSEPLDAPGNSLDYNWPVLVSLIASIILAGLATLFISSTITTPVKALRNGLLQFEMGNFENKIPSLSTAELSELGAGMNETASKVREVMNRLTEQRNMLDAVLESMTEGVMAVGCDERLIGMNHFACELLGIDIGKSRGRLVYETTRDVDLLGFVKLALSTGRLEESEITLMGKTERNVKLTGSPLHGSDGSMTGLIVVLTDCTKLRHLEGIRKDFVANVSHELKTPITSIKGFIETLLGSPGVTQEEAKRFLEIIAKHASRLNGIVEDLMELSRIEEAQAAGRVELQDADPGKAVELSVAYMKDRADLKKITVITDIKPGKCLMNQSLIEHAVSNLLDNAINYSDEGKRIIVTGENIGSNYIINVKDEGVGIEKHHLPRIFERFYRVDKGRGRTKGGTGLGLAIVKHIIEAHGGSVSVESDLGIGSTFVISLPLSGSSQSPNK